MNIPEVSDIFIVTFFVLSVKSRTEILPPSSFATNILAACITDDVLLLLQPEIIAVNSNPKDIASLILFGKATYRKMIQNLIWATGYNVVAIPLAAGVLYKYGILLTPAVAAVFMSVSTIVVAINAKMLKVKSVSKKN